MVGLLVSGLLFWHITPTSDKNQSVGRQGVVKADGKYV